MSKVNSHFAEDVYGFTLDYFLDDYKSVNHDVLETEEFQIQSLNIFGSDFRELYTGNIASISQAYSQLESPLNDEHMNHHTALYSYDQLHRIKAAGYVITDMNQASIKNNNIHPIGSAISDQFKSTYSYDPNGNLETLTRNGHTQDALSDLPMDDFVYNYTETATLGVGFEAKKLKSVSDNFDGDGSPWELDLDGQPTGNYKYDEIGQIIKDVEGGIGWIEWNVQNKIERIVRPNQIDGQYLDDIEFQYDALGNRISKILKPRDTSGNILDETFWRKDYYIRDANGQEMAIYSQQMNVSTGTIYDLSFLLNATHLYGSSRLGLESKSKGVSSILNSIQFVGVQHTFGGGIGIIQEAHINSANYNNQTPNISNDYFEKDLGFKQFEISNHLGNVTAIVQDCKTLEIDLQTLYNVYRPRISSLSDYYPFGMQMPGRQFSQEEYRYGFNGMEKDDELAGEGNSYTTHFRQYDSRIGKWLSVDPKYSSFASSSPYLSFNGNPILYSDILGDSSVVDRSGYMTHYDPEDEDLRIFMPDQDGNLYHIGDLGGEVCSDMWFENLLNENARIAEELWDPGIPLFPAMNIIREKSFKGRVRKEGEWDYKYRSPSNMNKYTKEMPLHLLGVSFYRSDTDNGSGDLAGTLFIYGNDIGRPEDLNNMHFGVIGNAYGLFTEEFMLKQAGAVERAKWKDEHGRDVPQDWRPVLKVHSRGSGSGSNYDVNYTKTIIGAPFGDSPMDHNWIKKGFIFYPSKLF